MIRSFKIVILSILSTLCVGASLAQGYPGIVTLESIDDKVAVFTSLGIADKKQDVETNAVQSLFHTLFFTGVDGVNNGDPLISTDKPEYTANFIMTKSMFYGGGRVAVTEVEKNPQKVFQGVFRVKVPIQSLLKELTQNGVYKGGSDGQAVDGGHATAMPTIIVVPYKKDGESYKAILSNDFDRRVAVSKVQDGFESRGVSTIGIVEKIEALTLRAQYEASTASSNDKNLLMSSGADVYVTVDLQKDIQESGSRVSLIMKAYETSSGTILAAKDGFTRRFKTSAVDQLCSYAVSDNLSAFLDDIVGNLNKQVTESRRVVLQVAIGGNSMATMDDQVGSNNYRLSDVIRQWVRLNSDQGKYHLQGVVAESMIFDYIMIPLKDSDGFMMDAAQFSFLLHSYLSESQGVRCSSRVDGNTIYLTIE